METSTLEVRPHEPEERAMSVTDIRVVMSATDVKRE